MTKIFNVHSLLTIVANKRMLPIFFDNIHLIHDHCNKYSGIMLAVLVQLVCPSVKPFSQGFAPVSMA